MKFLFIGGIWNGQVKDIATDRHGVSPCIVTVPIMTPQPIIQPHEKMSESATIYRQNYERKAFAAGGEGIEAYVIQGMDEEKAIGQLIVHLRGFITAA